MSSAAADTAPIRGCTCSKLRRLTRRVTAVYDRALAQAGMRVTQYSVLAFLRRTPGSQLSALAEAMDMDRTTLTRNLKPLVDAGWVETGSSEHDARVRTVHLTARGEAQFQMARSYWRRAQNEVTASIGQAGTSDLHELIDRYLPLFRPVEEESE